MICWGDMETERRQRRIARSQPIDWRHINWCLILGYGGALLFSIAVWIAAYHWIIARHF